MNRHKTISLRVLAVLAWVLALVGCARMGQPDGGWYDDTPPQIVSTSPADKGTHVKSKRVTITFDEFIKVEDATNKVVVSPPQLEVPEIKGAGKKIIVDLKDSLKKDMTYTIDFSDAISDNNEGNPLGNYTFSFSTGERIDTFEVSGTVLEAGTLEPVKSILVGLYDDLSDSAFTTKPFLRVARTDSRGRFIIRGVAPGTYRVYALQDADGNYLYNQKSEMLAFSHETFVPSCGPDIRQDTIWRDSLRIDSIVRVPYTHFYPDNIVLRAFTTEQTDRYLLKTDRTEPNRLGFYFSYGHAELPVLKGLNFNSDSAFVVESNIKRDTITYWLRDTMLINNDSLSLSATYWVTDTAGVLQMKCDTLLFQPKVPYEKRQKQLAKDYEKWKKQQEKRKKKGEPYDSIQAIKNLDVQVSQCSSITPEQDIYFTVSTPLSRCDTSAVHLYSKIDSLWYRSKVEFRPVPGHPRRYELLAEWRPDVEYSLEVDSAAFEDIYGLVSGPIKQGIKVKKEDEFGTYFVKLSGIDDTAHVVVQLLNSSDAVVKEVKAQDGTAEFYYVTPGKYYMRAFVDTNDNGVWDTGDYYAQLEPEPMYYYPKEIECKAKWDITTQWNLTAVPLDRQKPQAITKQKADKEKKLRNRNADRARELGIEYKPVVRAVNAKVKEIQKK